MQIFKQLWQQPLNNNYSGLVFTALALAFIGIADAGYLTIEHLRGIAPACTILEGCDVVTSSVYAEFFGIPTAAFGLVYYLTQSVLLLLVIDTKRRLPLLLFCGASIAGLLFSLWFVYLQLFVLHAICIYCMGSAASSTMLFTIGLFLYWKNR